MNVVVPLRFTRSNHLSVLEDKSALFSHPPLFPRGVCQSIKLWQVALLRMNLGLFDILYIANKCHENT